MLARGFPLALCTPSGRRKKSTPRGISSHAPAPDVKHPAGKNSRHNSRARCKQYLFGCLIPCQGVTIGEFPKYLSQANNQRSKDKIRPHQRFICCAPCSSILSHPAGILPFSLPWPKESPILSPAYHVSSARSNRFFSSEFEMASIFPFPITL